MFDKTKRKINYLRLSITEICNLKCQYCVPEKFKFNSHSNYLNSDEIEKIISAVGKLGIDKIRITGGEPLTRKDFGVILKKINNNSTIKKIAITTNGINLLENLEQYKKDGLTNINISLDSLSPQKYNSITRGGDFSKIFKTIKKAVELNFEKVRLNVVIMHGVNDDEIFDFVELTKNLNIGVRFIELMPIGEGRNFNPLSNDEVLTLIKEKYSIINNKKDSNDGPAKYFKVKGYKGEIGFISPLSNRFCEKCNRVRVTSSGFLKLCLHYNEGINLKPYLKDSISCDELALIIKNAIYNKPKEHNMTCNTDNENTDTRRMNEIGG